MKKTSLLGKISSFIGAHKIGTVVVALVVIVGGYYAYSRAKTANSAPQYVLSVARNGTLRQTVTGSGQVSASNQTDIQSTVSGTIQSINVNVGQNVTSGQLIATIDSKNAAISLQNAKLALEKITEPAKATDLSNATDNLSKSYNDAFNSASTVYLDLPSIVTGMKDLFYSQTGFLSDSQSSSLNTTARSYRDTAGIALDTAINQYTTSLAEFKGLSRSSATPALDNMIADTYTTMKDMSDAINKTQAAVTFITSTLPNYDPKDGATAATNVNSWATQINSDLSGVVSSQNTVATTKNSLTTLESGADALDIQTAQLNLEQAQQAYNNYFIRAPYDGVIGRIPVNVYGQAGGSTVIATIIGQQKIATISLNEVDAAKVKVGQAVMITFDAIDNFNATGTVSQVDQVGTVTQGVVSYAVKILINTADDRIKPGMSVNTTIITNQEDNVLLVPSSAVKTQGRTSYVQTFDQGTVMSQLSGSRNTASSTRGFASTTRSFASTTRAFGSTTRTFTGGSGSGAGGGTFGGSAQGQGLTITSATLPAQDIVTIGDADDTNTVILSGLNPGTFVVTRTITSGATVTTAPSILSSLGGARGGGAAGGGAVRVGAGGGGRAGN